jgi:hypothetical protein
MASPIVRRVEAEAISLPAGCLERDIFPLACRLTRACHQEMDTFDLDSQLAYSAVRPHPDQ